jgi:hypothetical protein
MTKARLIHFAVSASLVLFVLFALASIVPAGMADGAD